MSKATKKIVDEESIEDLSGDDSEDIFLPYDPKKAAKTSAIFFSEDSPKEPLEATKATAIFVNCYLKNGRIFLEVNSVQRPDVEDLPTGEDQGDHVTPYAIFLSAIVNSADQFSIEEIPGILRKIAKAILPHLNKIDDIAATETHDREKRKKLTATLSYVQAKRAQILQDLEGIPQDSPLRLMALGMLEISDHKTEFKSDLKDGALAKYCREIAELAKTFLLEVQSEEKTAFPSKGRVGKDRNEGPRVKETIYALAAINSLYRLRIKLKSHDLTDEEKKDLARDFREELQTVGNETRLGFNKLNRTSGKSSEEAAKLTKEIAHQLKAKRNDVEEVKDYLEELDDKLIPDVATIHNLFYDLFDLERVVNFSKKIKDSKKTKETQEIREVEDLYDLCARHVVVVFTAFQAIAEFFNKNTQDLIINGFLESVIEKQGWKDCDELGTTKDKQCENLRKKVDQRIEKVGDEYQLNSKEKVKEIEDKEKAEKAAAEKAKKPSATTKNKNSSKLKANVVTNTGVGLKK